MRRSLTRFLTALVCALCVGTPAAAGLEPGLAMSLGSGFVHPFLGADHLLAITAAGALAVAPDGRARSALPLAFLVGMGLGLQLGASGLHIPFVEALILSSVVILAGLLAIGRSLSKRFGVSLLAVLSFFHGEAHGLELEGAMLLPFAAGVLVGTALLLAWGSAFASMLVKGLERSTARLSLRLLGAGLSLGGVGLIMAG